MGWSPVWARGRCRISPPRFLAECCKRQLNQGSFVLLYFRLFTFFWFVLSLFVFSCTVLFVSISQVIGCEDRLRNDLYCVGWGIKLYSNQTNLVVDRYRLFSNSATTGGTNADLLLLLPLTLTEAKTTLRVININETEWYIKKTKWTFLMQDWRHHSIYSLTYYDTM